MTHKGCFSCLGSHGPRGMKGLEADKMQERLRRRDRGGQNAGTIASTQLCRNEIRVLFTCIMVAEVAMYASASALPPLLPLVRNPAVYSLDARIATRELTLRKGSPATINDLTGPFA